MHDILEGVCMNIVKVFAGATKLVGAVPEPFGRAVFSAVGTAVGLSNSSGAVQLRKNLQRVTPLSGSWAQRRRSAKAMRSYLRYYYEMFRLPALSPEQITARVTIENDHQLRAIFGAGQSCSGALMHLGNWDIAGAWANLHLAPVHTIAEKLEPQELSKFFLDFRRELGMTIYQAVKGGRAIERITRDLGERAAFAPILCDRDLSSTGIEVSLFGHPLRVAAGAALVSQNLGTPMFPVHIATSNFKHDKERVRRAGSPWGIHLTIGEPIHPSASPNSSFEERSADLARMNQEWMNQLETYLPEHLTDWHMLQKVFVADLDPERLTASRAASKEEDRT